MNNRWKFWRWPSIIRDLEKENQRLQLLVEAQKILIYQREKMIINLNHEFNGISDKNRVTTLKDALELEKAIKNQKKCS